ncbi:hypothetical protein TNCV_2798561 [Trichonephila clavipes]|nr:hypothetical protein TNCV_2798561 [Trichonephila clavipes]
MPQNTVHLQTSMPSPGFESKHIGTAISVSDQQESGLSATTFKMLSSSLGLGTANTSKMEGVGTAHRQPASYLVTWNESVPRS